MYQFCVWTDIWVGLLNLSMIHTADLFSCDEPVPKFHPSHSVRWFLQAIPNPCDLP